MISQWYFTRGEVKQGPFSSPQLRTLADAGTILPSDTVWKVGVARGSLASKVKHLFASTPSTPGGQVLLVPLSPPTPSAELFSEELVPLDLPVLAPVEPVAKIASPPPVPTPVSVRKGHALAVRGAIIINQDGVNVKYRKKCTNCAHTESSWHTTPIKNGAIKSAFFCPKCRKNREVELKGSLS